MKPSKCLTVRKKLGKESKRSRNERKQQGKVEGAVSQYSKQK